MKCVAVVGLLCLMFGLLSTATENTSLARVASGTWIVLGAYNVDDRIDMYVNGKHMGSCTWTRNPGCKIRVKVQMGSLKKAKIRFKLTNYVYNGICWGTCGKYAGNFYIENKQGKNEWSDSVYCHARNCSGGNTSGVKYDKTVTWHKK